MRVPLAVSGIVVSLLLALAVSGDDAPSLLGPGKFKFLEKPGAFETLVNPNCSHCIDEAKRPHFSCRRGNRSWPGFVENMTAARFPCGSFWLPIE